MRVLYSQNGVAILRIDIIFPNIKVVQHIFTICNVKVNMAITFVAIS
jgi:hypothetical protein